MKIYLIRHGETTGDVEDRFGGDYEDNLTEKGREQVKRLAEVLKEEGIKTILHSPRVRAVETARIISDMTGAPMEEIHDFRERNNYGVLTGLVKREGAEQFPEEFAKIQKDKTYHNVTGSESYGALKDRVLAAFDAVGKRGEQTLAIVTHGGVIGSIAREVFGYLQIKIGDCGIVEIDYDGKEYKIVCLTNATA